MRFQAESLPFDSGSTAIITPIQQEFSRYSAIAFARQLAFADFVGASDWKVDIQAGTVDFGNGRKTDSRCEEAETVVEVLVD